MKSPCANKWFFKKNSDSFDNILFAHSVFVQKAQIFNFSVRKKSKNTEFAFFKKKYLLYFQISRTYLGSLKYSL